MLMGFILHFISFLVLTYKPEAHPKLMFFLPISVFCRKGISKKVQMERNLRERDFLNKRDPGDLEWASRNNATRQGAHLPP